MKNKRQLKDELHIKRKFEENDLIMIDLNAVCRPQTKASER